MSSTVPVIMSHLLQLFNLELSLIKTTTGTRQLDSSYLFIINYIVYTNALCTTVINEWLKQQYDYNFSIFKIVSKGNTFKNE